MNWYNVSYKDPNITALIDAECGTPIPLIRSIRAGGVGFERFIMSDAPAKVLAAVDRPEDRRFCSLEVRSEGLLVRMRSRLETLAIPIGWPRLAKMLIVGAHDPVPASLVLEHTDGGRLVFNLSQNGLRSLRKRLPELIPDRYLRN